MKIETINGKRVKLLDDEFSMHRRSFRKIAEDERWYIFEVEMHDGTPKESNLELILKRITPKSRFDKNTEYTHVEKYPCSEHWGKCGWTVTNLEYAYRVIHRINMERGWGETALGMRHTPRTDVKTYHVDDCQG